MNDKELQKFWLDERDNKPRWFQDGSQAWGCSWEDFRDFYRQCERVYHLDGVLIYVERIENNANLHISVLRGATIDIEKLIEIREELLKDYHLLFAWVGKHNRGLKKIVEQCGMQYYGLQMFHGESHGRVLEWRCYSINKIDMITKRYHLC